MGQALINADLAGWSPWDNLNYRGVYPIYYQVGVLPLFQGSTLTFFFTCPFGQVKLPHSDFYLPEREIYLPENEI